MTIIYRPLSRCFDSRFQNFDNLFKMLYRVGVAAPIPDGVWNQGRAALAYVVMVHLLPRLIRGRFQRALRGSLPGFAASARNL
jgi:hypothetical protein